MMTSHLSELKLSTHVTPVRLLHPITDRGVTRVLQPHQIQQERITIRKTVFSRVDHS